MRCLLTGIEGKGVKAHIIPRSFYDLDYLQPLEIITNSETGYNGKSFVGIYDKNIVTAEGERIFSPWDLYAHQLLISGCDSFEKIVLDGKVIALRTPSYHYSNLKLFFISVLWRASVSTHPFFQHIRIDTFEPILRNALLNADSGGKEFFSVTLAYFVDLPTKTVMMDPLKEQYENVVYFRFFLGQYIAYIKVDQNPTPTLFEPYALSPDRPLVIIGREFHHSKEKSVVRNLVMGR